MNQKIIFGSVIIIIFLMTLPGIEALSADQANEQRHRGRRARIAPMEVLHTTIQNGGLPIQITVERGPSHNHPLMVIWIEDMQGNYIQTLFIAQSIAKGFFGFGDASSGKWMPGPIQRPASLPYWAHKRGVKSETGLYIPSQASPLPDAITGPTPKAGFTVNSQIPDNLRDSFQILMEINQSWDWNAHWTNNKFPNDMEYYSSAQPALVYRATINPAESSANFQMLPVGHSHWSGKTGELFTDLSTITTALKIINRATITFPAR